MELRLAVDTNALDFGVSGKEATKVRLIDLGAQVADEESDVLGLGGRCSGLTLSGETGMLLRLGAGVVRHMFVFAMSVV